MRDLQLAMELIRNFAARAGVSIFADLRITLTFSDRRDEAMFAALVKQEFSLVEVSSTTGRITIAGIQISYNNTQDTRISDASNAQ